MMPYVAFVIPFWAVYNQMNTNLNIQGCQMNDEIFGMRIASSQMSTWNTIGVLVGVPLMDRIVYPLMGKYVVVCMRCSKFPVLRSRRFGPKTLGSHRF